MPKFNEFLFGKKDKVKQVATLTPEQQQLMSLIQEGLEKGTGAFKDIFGSFDEQGFDEGVAKPALKNFQDNILPMIQEKFIAGNQALGSGMQRGQLKAATDLQSQLANLMYQAKQQHQQNRLAGVQNVLGTRGFENIYKQGNSGALPNLIQGGAQAAQQAAIAG